MLIDYSTLKRTMAQAPRGMRQAPDGYQPNSVCLPLLDRAQTVLLAIQKRVTAGYAWSDHIALPGGRIEHADRDAAAAALRELHEELGIKPAAVELLGDLGHFQTVTAKHDLFVFVGHWTRPTAVWPDADEVARVLEIPLTELITTHCAAGYRHQTPEAIAEQLAYPYEDVRIWGVSARILHHFLELLLDHDMVSIES